MQSVDDLVWVRAVGYGISNPQLAHARENPSRALAAIALEQSQVMRAEGGLDDTAYWFLCQRASDFRFVEEWEGDGRPTVILSAALTTSDYMEMCLRYTVNV